MVARPGRNSRSRLTKTHLLTSTQHDICTILSYLFRPLTMSFGFSVGDFLAGAKLIADLMRVLSASKGASMEYQQLILDLQLVETTLIQIYQMCIASQLNTSAMNALACIVQSTKASITDFTLRTRKYRESLSATGSGNKVKDLWLKIGWSMYRPAEIRSLQQRLQLDLGSINCLISLAIRQARHAGH
jgi:hypothetical protein